MGDQEKRASEASPFAQIKFTEGLLGYIATGLIFWLVHPLSVAFLLFALLICFYLLVNDHREIKRVKADREELWQRLSGDERESWMRACAVSSFRETMIPRGGNLADLRDLLIHFAFVWLVFSAIFAVPALFSKTVQSWATLCGVALLLAFAVTFFQAFTGSTIMRIWRSGHQLRAEAKSREQQAQREIAEMDARREQKRTSPSEE